MGRAYVDSGSHSVYTIVALQPRKSTKRGPKFALVDEATPLSKNVGQFVSAFFHKGQLICVLLTPDGQYNCIDYNGTSLSAPL